METAESWLRRLILCVRLIVAVVVLVAGHGNAAVQIRIQEATITDRGLSLAVDSYTPTESMISGIHFRDRRQFLLFCPLPQASGSLLPENCVELASPSKEDDTDTEFVIASSGDYAVRIRDISTVVINQRAYAAGLVELLRPDHPGRRNWKVVTSWTKRPIFVSPSAARLVMKDGAAIKAFDLTGAEPTELHPKNLENLFAAVGSHFRAEAGPKVDEKTANMVDNHPDYLGLTDDLDYASADGGEMYARMIYHRQGNVTDEVPWRLSIVGSNQIAGILDVRKTGNAWRYLGMIWVDKSRWPNGVAILEQKGIILRQSLLSKDIADGYATGKCSQNWNPDRSMLVISRNTLENQVATWRFYLWRYGAAQSDWDTYNVDSTKIFEITGDGIKLKSEQIRQQ